MFAYLSRRTKNVVFSKSSDSSTVIVSFSSGPSRISAKASIPGIIYKGTLFTIFALLA